MRSSKMIHIISAHAEGEVGDVIVAGALPPPGETIWEQSRYIASDGRLRNFVLNEPRGGVFRHVNLLVPPKHPDADAAFIIMEPEDTPPMSGSNSICVATVLLDSGLVEMTEPETSLILEAPGGLVRVRAACRDGKAQNITVQNLPSFADKLDTPLEVEGHGTLTVDTAFGGDSFVIVDAKALGFCLAEDEAGDLARLGMKITAAANATTWLSASQPHRLETYFILPLCWTVRTGCQWPRCEICRCHPARKNRPFPNRYSCFCAHGGSARAWSAGKRAKLDGHLNHRIPIHRSH